MAELAEPSNSGDQAVTALHRELSPMLVRLARAMLRDQALAEDAVQDAFLLLATKIDEIPDAHRSGWLVRTVQFSALNVRRTRNRQQQLQQRWLVRQSSEPYEVEPTTNQLEQMDELDRVRTAMQSLPVEQQTVVRLRLVEDRTFQEIADQQQLPIGTVLSRMRLAVEKLRSRLR